jgi:hypothetical protein
MARNLSSMHARVDVRSATGASETRSDTSEREIRISGGIMGLTYEGPTVPIRVRCGCRTPQTLPVWLVSDPLAFLRQTLSGALAPDAPVMTYRCRHCKQITVITAADIYLSTEPTGA